MAETLDIFRYIGYLRLRWRWIAASCAVAVALAAAASLAAPHQYTAAARIVIEPPAGSDPRASMAVSPIYFESLKTYEQFASGDSLFRKMVDRFQLRSPGGPSIETLKHKVLRVGVVHNTRILAIEVTLPDPRLAQQLAQSLAESTVELSRSLTETGNAELLGEVQKQEREARDAVDSREAAWAQLVAEEPVSDLQAVMNQSADLRATLEQQRLSAELLIADDADRQKSASAAEAAEARKESANAVARLEEIHRQIASVSTQQKQREILLSVRSSHRDRLAAERSAAQSALSAIQARLRDLRATGSYRGEQLRIIDPGVVPERPSSPNLPLNVMAAFLLGLVLPILYLTLELNYRERSATARPWAYQQGGR